MIALDNFGSRLFSLGVIAQRPLAGSGRLGGTDFPSCAGLPGVVIFDLRGFYLGE
ncbi:hypothetical protein ACFSC1_02130 [Paracoccus aurantiacus]|uniref:hypothetical protein n=1 Tax=Paracoccus aurantiacus TaxID=2599412 RepID=UPI00363EEFAA